MKMRQLIKTIAVSEEVDLAGFADDPIGWLSRQMQTMPAHDQTYLLAHADDGVIWGRLDQEGLITSHEVAPEYSPPLCAGTLQTVRIFGPISELLIWRDEVDAWAGRLISENAPGALPEWTQAFNEEQIVLGTKTEPLAQDFTLMSEGTQGLVHVVPLLVTGKVNEEHRPLRLVVRHYVKADDYGFLQVNASRLYCLRLQTKESNS